MCKVLGQMIQSCLITIYQAIPENTSFQLEKLIISITCTIMLPDPSVCFDTSHNNAVFNVVIFVWHLVRITLDLTMNILKERSCHDRVVHH